MDNHDFTQEDDTTFAPSLRDSHTLSNSSSRPGTRSSLHSSISSLPGSPSPSIRRSMLMSSPLSSLRDLGLKAVGKQRFSDEGVASGYSSLDEDGDVTAGEDGPHADYFGRGVHARVRSRSNTEQDMARHQDAVLAAARVLIDVLDAARAQTSRSKATSSDQQRSTRSQQATSTAEINDTLITLFAESKEERKQTRAREMESTIADMSAIIDGVKAQTLSLPATDASPLNVRTWFTAVLEMKYDMDPAEAMQNVQNWKLLNGAALREVDQATFRGIMGDEVGWVLWKEVTAVLQHRDATKLIPVQRKRRPWLDAGLLIHCLLGVSLIMACISLHPALLYTSEHLRLSSNMPPDPKVLHATRIQAGIASGITAWLFMFLYLGYYYS